jgi:hypothetical protein
MFPRVDGSRQGGQPGHGLAAVASQSEQPSQSFVTVTSQSERPNPERFVALSGPVRSPRGKNTAMYASVDRTDPVKEDNPAKV